MRKFRWFAVGGAVAALVAAVLLIPAAGSADVADNKTFDGVIKQDGKETTSITVYGCVAGATQGTAPNVRVRADTSLTEGSTANAQRVRVSRGTSFANSTYVTDIYVLDTDTPIGASTLLPCGGSATQTWYFQPQYCKATPNETTGTCLNNGGNPVAWDNVGTRATVPTVGYTATSSSPPLLPV